MSVAIVRVRSAIGAVVVVLLSFVLCNPAPAQVSSSLLASTLTPDARAAAMGSAHVAIAEGASTLWWNPAGLGVMEGVTIASYGFTDIGDPFDLELRSFGLATAAGRAGFGAQLNRVSYVDYSEPFGGDERNTQYSYQVGCGLDLLSVGGVSRVPGTQLAVGASLKSGRIHLAEFDVTGTGWAADLGVLGRREISGERVRTLVSLGWVVRNLIDGGISWPGQGEDDPFGRADRLGAAVRLEAGRSTQWGPSFACVVSLEQEDVLISSSDDAWFRHAGAEVEAFGLVAGRVGYERDSGRDFDGSTYGFGVGPSLPIGTAERGRQLGFHFDYAKSPRAEFFGGRNEHYSLAVSLAGI